MRINSRRFFEFFFLLILCGCLVFLYLRWRGDQRANQLNYTATQLVTITAATEPPRSLLPADEAADETADVPDTLEPEVTESDTDIIRAGLDLSPLRRINADVVCWIEIPGVLSYPVLQGADNSYYLSHNWTGEKNAAGAIFLDYRASADLSDYHTLVYGHRMRNGSMFGSLKQYSDADFWQRHPYVFLSDENGIRQYDIYAAYEISVTGIAYQLDFATLEDRQDLIQYGLDNSLIDTGIVPTAEDSIVTLSTCSGNGHSTRWVVQAVRVK